MGGLVPCWWGSGRELQQLICWGPPTVSEQFCPATVDAGGEGTVLLKADVKLGLEHSRKLRGRGREGASGSLSWLVGALWQLHEGPKTPKPHTIYFTLS